MATSTIKSENWKLRGSAPGNEGLTYPQEANELLVYSAKTETPSVTSPVNIHLQQTRSTANPTAEYFAGASYGGSNGVGYCVRINPNTRKIDARDGYFNGNVSASNILLTAYYK